MSKSQPESGKTSSTHLHPVAKRLMAAKTMRSIGQGIMLVDLALYLHELNWPATAIGAVLTAGGLVSVVLVLFVGVLSDRLGRKPFLLFYEFLTAACALIGVFTTNGILLFAAIAFAGFGRGQTGSPGPFAPAEQAWLAAYVPGEKRGNVYSVNNALGFFGMATGALLAGATVLWDNELPGALAYRPLFALIVILSLVTAAIIATTRGEKVEKPEIIQNEKAKIEEKEVSRRENRSILKLVSINVINGIAVGLTGPMVSYWFAIKFGVSNAQIGTTLAITFFATGFSSLLQAKLAGKFGMVRSVMWMRIIGSILMLLLPLLPTYVLVSFVYIVRSAVNRGTQGARQALSVSLTRDRRRGFASSVNSLSMRVPTSVGPYVTGYLFEIGALAAPFYIAGVLQLGFAYLYGRTFRSYN
ncbi:MAG TPA: MFS transporter [Bacillales bacterium]